MFITELDVINEMLASLGESPLNEVEEDHPLVASGLRKLRIANMREQAKGWWFNEDIVNLLPDPVTGYIYVPADTINIDPTNPWTHLTQRGRRLFDPRREDGYNIGRAVRCKLLRLVPFEDLPPLAQDYVSCSAQVDFQKDYDADRLKYEQIVLSKREAFMTLRAEDIRNRGVNLLHTVNTGRERTVLGLHNPIHLG